MKSFFDYKERLFNRTPLKVLSYLCRVPHIPHYGREIARVVGVSIGATNQTLKLLLSLGLVTREKKGQLYLYRVFTENPLVEKFKQFENILDITRLVLRIKAFSHKVVLYGSCAAGEDTIESDIDLFVVTKEKEKVLSEIRKEEKRITRELKPVIVSVEEYLSMRNKKEALLEAVAKGVVLYEKRA
jgi:predicted nucleotidyltransferase